MLRRVTAQHLPASLADAKMHPAPVDPHALLTAKSWIVGFGNDRFCGKTIQMLAAHKVRLRGVVV